MRALRVAAVIVLAVFLVGAVVQVAFDRERMTLDAAARRTVASNFAHLSDGTTEYKLDGPNDGRTVVLLSGASVPFYIWDSTAAALAGNGYHVLRYNYYGRGFSDRPALRYDLATYDRQLTELLDTLGIRGPVDVAGLSMGGPIAANFADRHPERVRTLTLVDPAFGNGSGTPLPLRVPGVATLAMTLGASSMATGQLDDFVHPEHYPDWVSRYEVQMEYKGFRRSIMDTRRGDVLQRPARSFTTLTHSAIPILLIWGKSDRTVPLSESDSVRGALQRAEFHVVDGAGHLPNIEQAAAVDSLMLQFLRRPHRSLLAQAASCVATASSLTPSRWSANTAAVSAAARGPLRIVRDLPLPGPANRFDYQSIDPASGRLYLSHMNAGRVVVFDLDSSRVIAEVSGTPRVTGIRVVPPHHTVYASAAGNHEVAAIDEQTLKIVARIGGIRFPDGIAYAPVEHKVFVSDESGGADVVIDARSNTKIATIELGGEAGNTQYDSVSHCILVAVQTRNQLVAIDPASDQIVARYDLPGADQPHGWTLDEPGRIAFISGEGNGTLQVVDLRTMRVLSTHRVGDDPDVLAWDPAWRRLYVASESGVLSSFVADGPVLHSVGELKAPHAHTVSVDPRTHRVYLPLENIDGHPVLRILTPSGG